MNTIAKIKKEIKKNLIEQMNNKFKNSFVMIADKINELVDKYYNLAMEYFGETCMVKNNELFLGVDISKYLEKIRYEEKENFLLIAIDKDIVADYFIGFGNTGEIQEDSYFFVGKDGKNAIEKIISWLKKGYIIGNFHNHPKTISAMPSVEDINTFEENRKSNNWCDLENEYGVILPKEFKYSEWGVVNEFDYFSLSANKDNLNDIKAKLGEYFLKKDEIDAEARELYFKYE